MSVCGNLSLHLLLRIVPLPPPHRAAAAPSPRLQEVFEYLLKKIYKRAK
jgi:hypothetical protein